MKRTSFASPFSLFYPLREDNKTKLRFFLDSFAYTREEYIDFKEKALLCNIDAIVVVVKEFEERHKANRQASFIHSVFDIYIDAPPPHTFQIVDS